MLKNEWFKLLVAVVLNFAVLYIFKQFNYQLVWFEAILIGFIDMILVQFVCYYLIHKNEVSVLRKNEEC